ncbi:MAG: hypothetical protein HFF02_06750 [Erysipelotrichaceae bacterium]|nr:hypothetical protein [Erysipelotrichaceae bacterium]
MMDIFSICLDTIGMVITVCLCTVMIVGTLDALKNRKDKQRQLENENK